MKKALFILIFVLCASALTAGEISSGTWMQTASTAGEAECSVEIMSETDSIISVHASNGWKGFAYYDEAADMYTGFFELLPNSSNPDAKWRNRIFMMNLKYDGLTLTLKGESGDLNFSATYWKE
jgi:ABC-type amino acid transport substrate-binding protein